MIESVQNTKVKEWAKLKQKKYRDLTNTYLVESEHIVNEALKEGLVKELIVLKGHEDEYEKPYTIVSEAVLKKITSQITIPNVCAIVYKRKEQEVNGNIILLDDIRDPGNLGTIIRSAVAFDIKNIILSNESVDSYNEKVLRSCEGMNFHVNIVRTDLKEFILKHPEYDFYGTDVVGGVVPDKINYKKDKTGIIIGNEGHGLNKNLKNLLKGFVYIPMNGLCESLNAGVSASILMYELAKIEGE